MDPAAVLFMPGCSPEESFLLKNVDHQEIGDLYFLFEPSCKTFTFSPRRSLISKDLQGGTKMISYDGLYEQLRKKGITKTDLTRLIITGNTLSQSTM